ncbi:MAG: group 1 truncated hemoglobin [Usitatibacteraceae bacterium]
MPPQERSLYDRLGGQVGVAEIVAETMDTVARDPSANRSLQKVDMKRLNAKIAEQICALTGGGCVYSGDDMKQSHAGLNITQAEFYKLVQVLREVLDRRVGEREKNELLKILAPMKRDVVTG